MFRLIDVCLSVCMCMADELVMERRADVTRCVYIDS